MVIEGMLMQISHKKAFTLIELVFVILIAGIIAATALPRFISISDDAHVTKLFSFTGTLNRSVLPSMWSSLQRSEPDQNGALRNSLNYSTITEGEEVETIPSEFVGLGAPAQISLANCLPSTAIIPQIGEPVGALSAGKVAQTALIGGKIYALGCRDGSLAFPPRFYLYDETDGVIVY